MKGCVCGWTPEEDIKNGWYQTEYERCPKCNWKFEFPIRVVFPPKSEKVGMNKSDLVELMTGIERMFKEYVVPGMAAAIRETIEKALPGGLEEYFKAHPPAVTIINNQPPCYPVMPCPGTPPVPWTITWGTNTSGNEPPKEG